MIMYVYHVYMCICIKHYMLDACIAMAWQTWYLWNGSYTWHPEIEDLPSPGLLNFAMPRSNGDTHSSRPRGQWNTVASEQNIIHVNASCLTLIYWRCSLLTGAFHVGNGVVGWFFIVFRSVSLMVLDHLPRWSQCHFPCRKSPQTIGSLVHKQVA